MVDEGPSQWDDFLTNGEGISKEMSRIREELKDAYKTPRENKKHISEKPEKQNLLQEKARSGSTTAAFAKNKKEQIPNENDEDKPEGIFPIPPTVKMKHEIDFFVIVNQSAIVHIFEKRGEFGAMLWLHQRLLSRKHPAHKSIFVSGQDKLGFLIDCDCLSSREHIGLGILLDFKPMERVQVDYGKCIFLG